MRSDWNMYNSPFIHSAAQLHLSPGQMLYSDSCHLIFILIFSSMCQIICLQIIPQGSVSCCSCRKGEIKVTFDLDVDWSLTSLLPHYLATECCSQYTPSIEHQSLPRKTVKSMGIILFLQIPLLLHKFHKLGPSFSLPIPTRSDLEKAASGESDACGHFVENYVILRTF